MGTKPILAKNELRKSALFTPSRVVSRPDNLEGGEEIEIAAQISIPKNGGWGWIVLIACFLTSSILDGICYTYGTLLSDISTELNVAESLAALVNSVAISILFIMAPLAAAFINRFGFRACIMTGSVLSSLSLFISYFATNIAYLLIFYGCFAGLGFCFINMAAGLIVGYYFEKLRAVAIAIASCGSSAGLMTLSPLNNYLVSLSGWRTTTLFHSGLAGLTFFLGMTFRPLLSFTVTKATDDPTRTVTYLPNLSNTAVQAPSSTKTDVLQATATERLFNAVSNHNFPTAAAVVDDTVPTSSINRPSSSAEAGVSKLTLIANYPQGGISQRHLKEMQSIMSKTNLQDTSKRVIEISVNDTQPTKRGCCGNCCKWEKHVPQSRPMYRDDAFYNGKLKQLPVYQKSVMDTTTSKTGLEYQLAVTRAATTVDVKEKKGVFTTAARRILATMMDPKLLRKKSFLCLSLQSLFIFVGVLVPYVFVSKKNEEAGLKSEDCNLFVTVIGFSNAMGRLILGFTASKFHPLRMYTFLLFIAGLSTSLSSLSHNIYFQYGYCFIFGLSASSISVLRSLVLVSLYGLDNLTNATGMILLFHGIGSLVSTPLASVIKNSFGYSISFIVAGLFMIASAILLIVVKIIYTKEENETKDTNKERHETNSSEK